MSVSLLAARGQRVALGEFGFELMMGRWLATLERVAGERHRPPRQEVSVTTSSETLSSRIRIR